MTMHFKKADLAPRETRKVSGGLNYLCKNRTLALCEFSRAANFKKRGRLKKMAIPKDVLIHLDAALEAVSTVLSEVPNNDEDWNKVVGIQGDINDNRDTVARMLDGGL